MNDVADSRNLSLILAATAGDRAIVSWLEWLSRQIASPKQVLLDAEATSLLGAVDTQTGRNPCRFKDEGLIDPENDSP